jgi:heptosyltransferase III
LANSSSILVVRPGALGDSILTVPVIDSIRAASPGARITVLGNRAHRDLMPEYVDMERFDAPQWAWLLVADQRTPPPGSASYDAAYVILNRPDDAIRNLRRAGTPAVFHAASRPPAGVHLVAHLHRALGLPVPPRASCLRRLAPAAREELLWVHPGSGGPSKCLPLSLLVPLVWEVRQQTGYRVTITCSEEDAFLARSPDWKRLIAIPGTQVLENRPLDELYRQMGRARLFIGNDSGISHLAAGLGVPAAVFFVKTEPECWAPWVPSERLRVIDLRGRDLASVDLREDVPALAGLIAAAASADSWECAFKRLT